MLDIDPDGAYSNDDHVEFDYFIPQGRICLVGEMKGSQSAGQVAGEYRTFREHFDWLRRQQLTNEQTWRALGIADEELRHFRDVTELTGFFVLPYLQKFDVRLRAFRRIACLYKSDWDLIKSYKETLGKYATPHLLNRLGIPVTPGMRPLEISEQAHSLMRTPNKKIASGNIGLTDLFTFEVSPYELLEVAQVYRRDELPDLSMSSDLDYQRPLIPSKLTSMRKKLRETIDFMFPNNILVVLSRDCEYRPGQQVGQSTLRIPHRYGSISIIDGQHRLFAYADDTLRAVVNGTSKIMVTAIKFHERNPALIRKFSAMTFVEINTSQTRIDPTLIDSIGYEILEDTRARALAAQVILRANTRHQSVLYGLFHTNQTSLGIIAAPTVLSALQAITNIKTIERLRTARRQQLVTKRDGYLRLFGVDAIDELRNPETLINKAMICLERYFGQVKSTFRHDWPVRGQQNTSAFQYARVIAGFVRLLGKFIAEGKTWDGIRTEMETIRTNILQLRNDMAIYNGVLFNPDHPDIPTSQSSDNDDFHFLDSNRLEPTSILQIGLTAQQAQPEHAAVVAQAPPD
jgi:DGQHR domain-containing protein